MRITSTLLSLTAHMVVVGAVLWQPVEARSARALPPVVVIDFSPVAPSTSPERRGPGVPLPDPGPLPAPPDIWPITPESLLPQGPPATIAPVGDPCGAPGGGPAPDWGHVVDVGAVDDPPVLLAGPIPAYPDLLRQAGLEGAVVLEAVVDTTGRVEDGSLVVISATHMGFVATARRALLAGLFRPGRVQGRAVRVRVRVPMDFRLRRGG